MLNEPSEFKAPSHISAGDIHFLEENAKLINGLIEGTYLTIGQVLLRVQKHFRRDPDLKGWFYRWVEETTHLGSQTARELITIAEEATDDPDFAALTKSIARTTMTEVAKLPSTYKQKVKQVLAEGHHVSKSSMREFVNHPFVKEEKLQELVEEFQTKLVDLQIQSMTAEEADQNSIKQALYRADERLRATLEELQEARSEANDLRKKEVTSEMLVSVLRKEIRSRELQLKEITKDPDSQRTRAIAKVQVELNQALDGMLSNIDKYDVSREDISEIAVKKLQDKLDLVYAKLRSTCRS